MTPPPPPLNGGTIHQVRPYATRFVSIPGGPGRYVFKDARASESICKINAPSEIRTLFHDDVKREGVTH